MLYAQTGAFAYLSLLLECKLLLKFFGWSTSRLTLLYDWLDFRSAFALHLWSVLYSIFHWLGQGGYVLQMRLAANRSWLYFIRIVWGGFACTLLSRLDTLFVLPALHLETCSVDGRQLLVSLLLLGRHSVPTSWQMLHDLLCWPVRVQLLHDFTLLANGHYINTRERAGWLTSWLKKM